MRCTRMNSNFASNDSGLLECQWQTCVLAVCQANYFHYMVVFAQCHHNYIKVEYFKLFSLLRIGYQFNSFNLSQLFLKSVTNASYMLTTVERMRDSSFLAGLSCFARRKSLHKT